MLPGAAYFLVTIKKKNKTNLSVQNVCYKVLEVSQNALLGLQCFAALLFKVLRFIFLLSVCSYVYILLVIFLVYGNLFCEVLMICRF